MKISLEAETFPLFAAGVLLVFLAELVFTVLMLRRHPAVRRAMMGHIVCILIAFFCLGFMLFIHRTTPDGGMHNSSGLLGLFGIFWFIGECCAVPAVSAALKESGKI